MDRTPYTYLIGWSNLNKFYYGVRYGKGCHPSDLWVKYFGSRNAEVKQKISAALIGHIISDETKLKISLTKLGKKRGQYKTRCDKGKPKTTQQYKNE